MAGGPLSELSTGSERADRAEVPAREGLWQRIDRADLARIGLVLVCLATVAVLRPLGVPGPVVVGVGLAGLLVGCWPILVEAFHDIRHRRMSMELSMLIAIAAAAAIGQWVTALAISVFVLAAEILEDLSMDRGRDALSDLMAFLPRTVQIRDGDRTRTIDLADLAAGQVVVVSPGGSVPVDGTVIAGHTTLDQSRITGESLPVDAAPGTTVYAGSINQTGAVEIRAERVGAQSSYGQIIETVQAAQTAQAPVQRLADRLAAWLVYLALAAAAVTYLATGDLRATISVVVVAGACGIAAGTPLAVLAGIARAARTDAFIKGGTHLETLSRVDTVIFDKTGTLTQGAPHVVDVHPATGHTAAEMLEAAATAEWYTEHPLGRAILDHAHDQHITAPAPDEFDYQPGHGITAHRDGHTIRAGTTRLVPEATQPGNDQAVERYAGTAVHVAVDDIYVGAVILADTIRDTAADCIADLHRLGLRVIMLTGDHHTTARAIADPLGIDDVRAELLPADKLDAINTEQTAGRRVVMVGDGVNDAPALATADVGIAIGTGTHIARETADIILISADLTDLTHTLRVARRARRIVMTNFAGTIAVDLAGMTLAALGLLAPLAAAIIHVGSETLFILNSARLIPRRAPAARK